ncbi:MAG: 23S rRNA (uracil(1939)-C(5))-methyltransferase RlmD [Clostridia bacterium]|nr:23S rRNA (uracil(1939)-C(5))-methyltransferase RlmD [Clostridia bacterium]
MIKKNDIFECDVCAFGSDGEGIAKIDGFAVFVPFAAKGDRIKLKILKANKNYGFGKVLEILKPSDDRKIPDCTAFGKCGGCTMQHLNYAAQLIYKREKVYEALKRIGGAEVEVMPCTPSPEVLSYRNKISAPVCTLDGKTETGFYAPHSHRVIPCDSCVLQDKVFYEIIETVKAHMDKYGIVSYDEENHKGNVRHIYIRRGAKTRETMVSVVSAKGKLKEEGELVSSLVNVCPGIKSIIINENRKKTNVILGDKYRVIYGNDYITDTLCGKEFKIHHNSFYQINSCLTELLYKKGEELLGDLSGKTVLDIYCGIGTISLTCAANADKIIGIEYVKEAAENAKENAALNGMKNAEFYAGDASEVMEKLSKDGIKADAVILDPPRKGCDEKLLKTVADLKPEKILYISCNPATLARDMKYLSSFGYTADTAYPFDMFPQTAHVETIVRLSRSDINS